MIDKERTEKRRRSFRDWNTEEDDDFDFNADDDGDESSNGIKIISVGAGTRSTDRKTQTSPVMFEKVAFYQNPGILMIVQSVDGDQKGEGRARRAKWQMKDFLCILAAK